MSYGYQRQPQAFIGNTNLLTAYLYDVEGEQQIPATDIVSATFTVMAPGDPPTNPSIEEEDGVVDPSDGTARYNVAAEINTDEGEYKAYCRFTYNEGGFTKIRDVPCDYEVVDAFVRYGAQPFDGAVDLAWKYLEDCFDSEQGGPWLRDMTLAHFDKAKMRELVPSVFMEINAMPPQTDLTPDGFDYASDDGLAFVAQGVLVAAIRHLMRSYTEQPMMTNSPVAWADRTRYQQAWSVIYQVELDWWKRLLTLYKQRFFGTGAKLLVGTKSGRMIPAPMRSRGIGRGWGY